MNRIANVLVGRLGLVAGNRVLLRSANNPIFVAAYLAVMKAGGVAVATMPLLRARDLASPIKIARSRLALVRRAPRRRAGKDEGYRAGPRADRHVRRAGDELEAMMAEASPHFDGLRHRERRCLPARLHLGHDGRPQGDACISTATSWRSPTAMAPMCCGPRADDIFIGSPPLAFTFGLGGLVVFPLAAGAVSVLIEKPAPNELVAAIDRFRPTVLFTAPTAYRAILAARGAADLSSLRLCVSAGEPLPLATFEAWKAATGISLMDGIGSTEMLHIFIGSPPEEIRPGATGRPVPGYEAKVVGPDGPRGRARDARATLRCAARPAAAISTIPARPATSATAGT